MTADGNRIKSYNAVIGRMFDPVKKGGQPFVLITSNSYSNTTSGHISHLRGAVQHMDCIYISNPNPYGKEDHVSNLREILSSIEYSAREYPKKRKESTREAVAFQMARAKSITEKYGDYFKLRNLKEYKEIMKFPMPTDENFEELLEQTIQDLPIHYHGAEQSILFLQVRGKCRQGKTQGRNSPGNDSCSSCTADSQFRKAPYPVDQCVIQRYVYYHAQNVGHHYRSGMSSACKKTRQGLRGHIEYPPLAENFKIALLQDTNLRTVSNQGKQRLGGKQGKQHKKYSGKKSEKQALPKNKPYFFRPARTMILGNKDCNIS